MSSVSSSSSSSVVSPASSSSQPAQPKRFGKMVIQLDTANNRGHQKLLEALLHFGRYSEPCEAVQYDLKGEYSWRDLGNIRFGNDVNTKVTLNLDACPPEFLRKGIFNYKYISAGGHTESGSLDFSPFINQKKIALSTQSETLQKFISSPWERMKAVVIHGPGLAKDYQGIFNLYKTVYETTHLVLSDESKNPVSQGSSSPVPVFAKAYQSLLKGRIADPVAFKVAKSKEEASSEPRGLDEETQEKVTRISEMVLRERSEFAETALDSIYKGMAAEINDDLERVLEVPPNTTQQALDQFVKGLYLGKMDEMDGHTAQQVHRLADQFLVADLQEQTKLQARTQDLEDTHPDTLLSPQQMNEKLEKDVSANHMGETYVQAVTKIQMYWTQFLKDHALEAIYHQKK